MPVVDSLDLKILEILLKNSRTPFRRIAKELSIGESTVYSRINKLLDLGVLKGFTILIDYSRLGLGVESFVEIKVEPKYLHKVVSDIAKIEGISEIYEVSGEYPILTKIITSSNEELSKVIDMISSVNGVKEINVKYVLRKHYETESIVRVIEMLRRFIKA